MVLPKPPNWFEALLKINSVMEAIERNKVMFWSKNTMQKMKKLVHRSFQSRMNCFNALFINVFKTGYFSKTHFLFAND